MALVVITDCDHGSIAPEEAVLRAAGVEYRLHQVKTEDDVINMARDAEEGLQVFKKLSQVVSRFLDVSLDYVGCVARDERMLDAVRRQKSVVELYPRAAASHCFATLARTLLEHPVERRVKGNIQFLFRRYFEPAPAMRYL